MVAAEHEVIFWVLKKMTAVLKRSAKWLHLMCHLFYEELEAMFRANILKFSEWEHNVPASVFTHWHSGFHREWTCVRQFFSNFTCFHAEVNNTNIISNRSYNKIYDISSCLQIIYYNYM